MIPGPNTRALDLANLTTAITNLLRISKMKWTWGDYGRVVMTLVIMFVLTGIGIYSLDQ